MPKPGNRQKKRPKRDFVREKEFNEEAWNPKTELGRKVKSGEITDIDEIIDRGLPILEPEIVDVLLPGLQVDFLEVGQSKGKFGGGKRSIWRQTQKKTKEGNKPSFATVVVCGTRDGYVGIGIGKAKETVPAREKATRRAKMSIIKVKRGCGSWECACAQPHSVPFTVTGKVSSVVFRISPAPRGTQLCIEKECQKILRLAGIQDVYGKTFGQTRTKLNLVYACFEALKELSRIKIKQEHISQLGIISGRLQ